MRLQLILITLLSFLLFSCKSQSCKELPSEFISYNQALSNIRTASFTIAEAKSNFKSSWVKEIEYYSCDKVSGFFLYTTKKGKSYIHQDVPLHIWQELKDAKSKGSFISRKLKGRYSLSIE